MPRGKSESASKPPPDAMTAGTTRAGGRVPGLDIVRGLALVSMVFYHLMYDLVYVFGLPIAWFDTRPCFVWQQSICMTFIIVSGISFHLSRKPWKNGVKLLFCAAVISAVTYFIMPGQMIWFGILHFLGTAALLTALAGPVLDKIPPAAGFAAALLMFALFRHLGAGHLGLFGLFGFELPSYFYQSPWLFPIGLPSPSFASADYFPILPWWFLYLAGYYGGRRWLRADRRLGGRAAFTEKWFYRVFDASAGRLGRRSLMIYMLHQPLIYGTLYLLLR